VRLPALSLLPVRFLLSAAVAFTAAGCATSGNSGEIARATAPSIAAQPLSLTVTAGQTATFSVMASGSAPLAYQWQKNSLNIAAASMASYTTPLTTSGDNGAIFMVVVSNPAGSVTSNAATLTVNSAPAAPTITTQPASQTVIVGQTATFRVVATGSAPLSYQWQKNNLNIAGANLGSYTTSATVSGDNGAAFDVVVSNSGGTITSHQATLTVNMTATPPTITTQPANQTVTAGQMATFSVIATGTAPLSYQWFQDSAAINGATSSSYTTPVATLANSGEQFQVKVSNAAGNITSNTATLTVNGGSGASADVVTHHYDISRSGVNSAETVLTTNNVNSTTFGKVGEFAVDGQIDGQALYLSQLTIPGQGTRNVLYVATESDTVYAVDADSISGTSATILWKSSVLLGGESPADSASLPCGNISPNGITATPVIDRGRNAIYVEAMSKSTTGKIIHRLHALDLTTGKELFGGPVTVSATYPGTGGNSQNGTVSFDPPVHHERAALLESGGNIVTAWSGLWGDCGAYSAWVIAYSADTLAQTGAIDLVPNNHGGGMWMGGGGPAADAAGSVFVISGNGFGDTPGMNSYGNSFVRLSNSGGLAVADYFTPYNTISEDNGDVDFGSAAPLLLPDMVDPNGITRHLAVGAGKDGNLYVVDRDNMGQFNATKNDVYQQIQISSSENHSSPIFFSNTIYICPEGQTLKAFAVTKAQLASSPSSQSTHQFGSNGAVASISANGASNGIVWALDWGAGILFALDASNLAKELYDSNQAASSRDHFAAVGGHFITPMVASGRVYIGTKTSVAVFGLLP
jgi:hypothetical protein